MAIVVWSSPWIFPLHKVCFLETNVKHFGQCYELFCWFVQETACEHVVIHGQHCLLLSLGWEQRASACMTSSRIHQKYRITNQLLSYYYIPTFAFVCCATNAVTLKWIKHCYHFLGFSIIVLFHYSWRTSFGKRKKKFPRKVTMWVFSFFLFNFLCGWKMSCSMKNRPNFLSRVRGLKM